MTILQTEDSTMDSQALAPTNQSEPQNHPEISGVLTDVATVIAPVWPLEDYVAVNPYAGITERDFMDGRALLRLVSDCETLMPLDYYAEQFRGGQISRSNIETAIAELGPNFAVKIETILATLSETTEAPCSPPRTLRTISETVDANTDSHWSVTIRDEVSKFCSAHYDDGQATWASPWKDLPLFDSWRSMAAIDRNIETVGLAGFRALVSEMPENVDAAIVWLLQRLGVPESHWKSFLLCQAFSIPGWSAWAKYQTHWTDDHAAQQNDISGLLAIRLAYDVAISETVAIQVNWNSIHIDESDAFDPAIEAEAAARYILLRASEIAFRDRTLASLSINQVTEPQTKQKLAQLVFCIDVRSERIRRQLETQSSGIETFGFAGFFGMPIEFVPLGQSCGSSHVPVLLKPQFQLHEGLHETSSGDEQVLAQHRTNRSSWSKQWRRFQTSAVGCFSFVETMGLFYGWKLFTRAIGAGKSDAGGSGNASDSQTGPTLKGLDQQGVTFTQQVDLAESMLKGIGMTDNFSRLVAFCGHSSQTANNPLAAGLDCGACGGHSGEPNARMAATLLNQPSIRSALGDRGIQITRDTHFLGGLHNTTTDQLDFFDLDDVPASHQSDLMQLMTHAKVAGTQTATERMPIVASASLADVMRRAADWSEVRPEWGLAGNAAFIVAPRSMTKNANLDGRSFLHSYDFRSDPQGAVLESIMTAPMVVAHWINMQYYASTVDNDHFGSGNKTVHNVVGRFGILSGNGGDLMTGLPWQSLHTGNELQHIPMRLQSVIAAPRGSIDRVIGKHELIRNMVDNCWLHLIAIDDGVVYRYDSGTWQSLLESEPAESLLA